MAVERSRTTGSPRPAGPIFAPRDDYPYLSTRPLHILLFLLPLVIVYEIGSATLLSDDQGNAAKIIRAERLLSSFFELFGVGGLYLPGVLLVVVLLLWHFFSGDRWRVKWGVLPGMLVESVLWSLPLLVIGQMVFRALGGHAGFSMPAQAALVVAPALQELPRSALAVISIGAGLYEELLFRLVAIAAVHAVAADILRISDASSKVIAVVVSALLFALYHDVALPAGGVDPARLGIYILAGVYFGAVYVLRGFGIVVATHVLYDMTVLVLLPR